MIKIEKGIPIPAGWSKYPLRDMAVGDSFLVSDKASSSARKLAIRYSKKSGAKFATRRVEGGLRVWRTA